MKRTLSLTSPVENGFANATADQYGYGGQYKFGQKDQVVKNFVQA